MAAAFERDNHRVRFVGDVRVPLAICLYFRMPINAWHSGSSLMIEFCDKVTVFLFTWGQFNIFCRGSGPISNPTLSLSLHMVYPRLYATELSQFFGTY